MGFEGASVAQARLAQSAERKALNLVVVGSSPTVGVNLLVSGSPCVLRGRGIMGQVWRAVM